MANGPLSDPRDLPSNSNKSKKVDKKPKIEPVVKGEVKIKKPSIASRVKDNATGDDARSVGEYIIFDVLLPAGKRAVADSVSQGIEMLLFGRTRPRTSANHHPATRYTSYSRPSYANEPPYPRDRNPRRYRDEAGYNFNDIILEDMVEAEMVLDRLTDLIDDYGSATVGDLYDLVGVTRNGYTDRAMGWTTIGGSTVRAVRDGYVLILPRPERLTI